MTAPYYADDLVETLRSWASTAVEVTDWLAADVLVTDPPYGRAWKQGHFGYARSNKHDGIAGDSDTAVRDSALTAWGDRPAVVFGDLTLAPPPQTRQTCVYHKTALNAGLRGATSGFRRDAECHLPARSAHLWHRRM